MCFRLEYWRSVWCTRTHRMENFISSPHVYWPIFCKQLSLLKVSTCLTRPIFVDLIAQMVPDEECTPRSSSSSTWSLTSCIVCLRTVRIAAQTLCNVRHVQFWRFLPLITLSFFHSLTLVTKHNLQGISGPNQFYQHLHCESSTSSWEDRWWMSPKTFLASDYKRLRAAEGFVQYSRSCGWHSICSSQWIMGWVYVNTFKILKRIFRWDIPVVDVSVTVHHIYK